MVNRGEGWWDKVGWGQNEGRGEGKLHLSIQLPDSSVSGVRLLSGDARRNAFLPFINTTDKKRKRDAYRV